MSRLREVDIRLAAERLNGGEELTKIARSFGYKSGNSVSWKLLDFVRENISEDDRVKLIASLRIPGIGLVRGIRPFLGMALERHSKES